MIRNDIELFYKFEGKIFKIGDVCKVKVKEKFTDKTHVHIGRILFPTIGDTLELDCSGMLFSNLQRIDMDDILEWEGI